MLNDEIEKKSYKRIKKKIVILSQKRLRPS
jgi:hypothetical protein